MDAGLAHRFHSHPSRIPHRKGAHPFQIQPPGKEGQPVLPLGNLIDSHLGGQIAHQRNIDQSLYRPRRFPETVNQLIGYIHCILLVSDACNFFIYIDAVGKTINITLGDMGAYPHVNEAFLLHGVFRLLPFFLQHSLSQHLDIHIVSHRFHMPMLLRSQDIARSADFQISHGNAEPGTEGGKLPDGGKALGSNVGHLLVGLEGQIGKGTAVGTPHPAPQLVQLGKAHPVGVLDDEGVAVGDVHPRLYDSGTHQDINLMVHEHPPGVGELFLSHPSMGGDNARSRHQRRDAPRTAVDGGDVVVQIKHLSAPAQLPFYRFGQNPPIVFQHIGLHRMAVGRSLLDYRHIPHPRHSHIQGPGNGGSREGQHIDVVFQLLEPFLVGHAKTLFLVDDHKAQILKLHILLQQPVGADDDVNLSPRQLPKNLFLLLRGAVTGENLHLHGKILQTAAEGIVMLPGQNGGGHQHRHLFGIHHRLKHCAKGNLRLAEAHIAAKQPVHGTGHLHIGFDLVDAPQLIVGLVIRKTLLKLPLPIGIRTESIAFGLCPLGIQGDQFLGHILYRAAYPLFGFLPFHRIELIEPKGPVLSGTDVTGNQIQLGDGHKQRIAAGIFDFDIILGNPLHLLLDNALEDTDAVGHMHHRIPKIEIRQAFDLLSRLMFLFAPFFQV